MDIAEGDFSIFFFQAEDGIRDLVRSRGLGDVYKRQVLVQGENGTGKELIAKSIHYNSHRKDKNFVIQNCSAFNDNLSLIHI